MLVAEKDLEKPKIRTHFLPRTNRRRERFLATIYLAPTVALLIILIAAPLAGSVFLSFSNFDLASASASFVGVQNYQALFEDPILLQSLQHTVIFTIVATGSALLIGLGVAMVLNENFPGKRVATAALLVPWALPPVVVAMVFFWILNANYGILNAFLTGTRILDKSMLFFGNENLALYTLVGIQVWKTVPLMAIFMLLALQYLPKDLLESAQMDGAKRWHRFRYVILPHLKPTMIAASIIQVLLSVQAFDLVFALTLGGPGYSTYMILFYAYKATFGWLNFGYGTILGFFVTVIVVVFALLVTRRQVQALATA